MSTYCGILFSFVFFFNVTATTDIYTYSHTLSLHYALPICHLEVDGKSVSAAENVFPFRISWGKGGYYYVSDGKIRYRSGARLSTIDFAATLEDRKSTRLNSSH